MDTRKPLAALVILVVVAVLAAPGAGAARVRVRASGPLGAPGSLCVADATLTFRKGLHTTNLKKPPRFKLTIDFDCGAGTNGVTSGRARFRGRATPGSCARNLRLSGSGRIKWKGADRYVPTRAATMGISAPFGPDGFGMLGSAFQLSGSYEGPTQEFLMILSTSDTAESFREACDTPEGLHTITFDPARSVVGVAP